MKMTTRSLRDEVEAAIRSLKNDKAAGVDNVPAELIKHGGETVADILNLQYDLAEWWMANTMDAVTHHHSP